MNRPCDRKCTSARTMGTGATKLRPKPTPMQCFFGIRIDHISKGFLQLSSPAIVYPSNALPRHRAIRAPPVLSVSSPGRAAPLHVRSSSSRFRDVDITVHLESWIDLPIAIERGRFLSTPPVEHTRMAAACWAASRAFSSCWWIDDGHEKGRGPAACAIKSRGRATTPSVVGKITMHAAEFFIFMLSRAGGNDDVDNFQTSHLTARSEGLLWFLLASARPASRRGQIQTKVSGAEEHLRSRPVKDNFHQPEGADATDHKALGRHDTATKGGQPSKRRHPSWTPRNRRIGRTEFHRIVSISPCLESRYRSTVLAHDSASQARDRIFPAEFQRLVLGLGNHRTDTEDRTDAGSSKTPNQSAFPAGASWSLFDRTEYRTAPHMNTATPSLQDSTSHEARINRRLCDMIQMSRCRPSTDLSPERMKSTSVVELESKSRTFDWLQKPT
ncbi:hypothetical protein BJ875DRAFT_542660 [Amylocarpus encephaloides]|uniref:Uncharacterized protein n=1 Tax=Amylocarpus encephaloides TaxID=45428 RepID=A0A9P7YJL4_9HELO|nr:hypothetical protein BJ875DRAFT_542660 [Amylocarpus encephaloides]